MSAQEPFITYTLRELLERIEKAQTTGFAEVKTMMATKADKSDVVRLEGRLDEHGREIGRIKDQLRSDEAAESAVSAQRAAWRDWRRWAIGVVALGVASVPGFLALIH